MKKIFKVLFKTVLIVIVVLFVTILGLNGLKYVIYNDFYNISEKVGYNAGLGESYVPQGVAEFKNEDETWYLTSGYTSNDTPSRVYVISPKNSYYVNIKVSDHDFTTGHLGGITVSKDKVYIANDGEVYICNLKDFLKSPDEEKVVRIIESVSVLVHSSFIFSDIDNKYLYVGEFNNGNEYKTEHIENVNDGKDTYYAYVDVYDLNSFKDKSKPISRYSIRDKVQGFAISNDKIVLSTSFGLASSYFYVYDLPKEYAHDNVYYLDDSLLVNTIKAPAMAEGLDYDGEKFITIFESAANKYFFGKLFNANKIIGLTI